MVCWLVVVRRFQFSFKAVVGMLDILLTVQLVLVSVMVWRCRVLSRPLLLFASLPITVRRPPQSVDAGGSGRQTVSPAAAHHTTTSLSLPSALLWCPAPTPDTNQTLHSAQTPSPAPGESQLTCQPKPQRASTSPLWSWRRGKQ